VLRHEAFQLETPIHSFSPEEASLGGQQAAVGVSAPILELAEWFHRCGLEVLARPDAATLCRLLRAARGVAVQRDADQVVVHIDRAMGEVS
jgi:hypothetical protein